MKYLLSIFFLSVALTGSGQKLENGFYLSIDCNLNSENLRWSLLNKKEILCLPNQPFLAASEITTVSEVTVFNNAQFFEITISDKAVERINIVYANIKNPQVALVIENEVMFVLHLGNVTKVGRLIRIGNLSLTDETDVVQNKIAAYLESLKKTPTN